MTITIGNTERAEAAIQCPIEGCGHYANFYIGSLPTDQARTLRPHLNAHLRPAVDALVEHMAHDHGGHADTCPRSVDLNDYCDCDVYNL